MLRAALKTGFGDFRKAVHKRVAQKRPADWHSKILVDALKSTLPKDYGPAYYEKLTAPKIIYITEPEVWVKAVDILAKAGEAKDIYKYEEYEDKFEMGKGSKRVLQYSSPLLRHVFRAYSEGMVLSILTHGLMATFGNRTVHEENKAVRLHHVSPHKVDELFEGLPDMGEIVAITKAKSGDKRDGDHGGLGFYQKELKNGYLKPDLFGVKHCDGTFHFGGDLLTPEMEKELREEETKVKEEKKKAAKE